MTNNPRVLKAFKATRALGIPDRLVKPVLKNLLAVYDKNWELIEEDNYRTLVDAYFESQDNKGEEDKREVDMGHGGSERPTKKLHLANDEDHGESEIPSRMVSRQASMESSEPCLRDGRAGSSSQIPLKQSRDKGKNPTSSAVSRDNHKKDFLIPKTEESTNCVPVSAQPAPMRRPGSSGGSTGGNSVTSLASSEVGTSGRDALHVSGPSKGPCRTEHSQVDLNGMGSSCLITREGKKPIKSLDDISKSTEKVKISLADEIGNESLPKFNYIPDNIVYQHANVNISLARISDEDCCIGCSGDCLSSEFPCACAQETGGDFVYTKQGLLKEDFLTACMREPDKQNFFYCQDCPHERLKNEYMPEKCKGHHIRKFIKECWRKCGCDLWCGNRVVQRGISCKLQVFLTPEGKGWGVRTLEVLQKGTFVCEYVGEILTNTELYERNTHSSGAERHTYPVTLDADWGSERVLRDEDALCLDATFHGNVARFINHRCCDANLIDIPVQVETPDRHYYHLAFFTTRTVSDFEELTWDYGIDFDDLEHPIEAFQCNCRSVACRGKRQKGRKGKQH
ncbi:unnamed protein product [Prunus armeniaca]